MNKKINMMTATYRNIKLSGTDASKLRGFFADLDTSDSNLHNHMEDGTDIYRYPKVQYKVIGGHPVIVAADEGIRSIQPYLMKQREIRIGREVYTNPALDIRLSSRRIGDSYEMKCYEFVTPWIALNQKNYYRYMSADEYGKEKLLSDVLVGNLLSLCKAFDVTIEQRLEVTYQLRSVMVTYKGKSMEGFVGSFQVNCHIPELLGIGKGTARGYGVVRRER